jgi:FMN phosphatase YigB (HAD superfamily)
VTRTATVLLLDFDGTVAVGHGPVHAYARAAAASLAPTAAARFRDEAEAAIEAWGTGAGDATTTDGLLPLDGYDLVRVLAERHGVGPHALSAAYLASRHALGTADAPVTAPDGLLDLLTAVRAHATIVLATNAPRIRLVETLTDLGVAPLLDRILTEVGKPAGMPRLLDAVGATPQGPARVLSVGDVWVNDLAPVAARGHATALVSRIPPPQARPTFLGPDLPSLYPDLHDWVRDGAARPLAVPTTTEG